MSGLDALIAKIEKSKKMSVLDKTKMDWKKVKDANDPFEKFGGVSPTESDSPLRFVGDDSTCARFVGGENLEEIIVADESSSCIGFRRRNAPKHLKWQQKSVGTWGFHHQKARI